MANQNQNKPKRTSKSSKPKPGKSLSKANNTDYTVTKQLNDERGLFRFEYNPDVLAEPELTNTKMATFMLAVEAIRQQSNLNDINTLYSCLNQYLALCGQSGMRVTNLTAYEACGVSKQAIDDWVSGNRRASQPEYKQFAMTVKGICRAYREQLGAEGKINPVTLIWWQKAHDGMRDDFVENAYEPEKKDSTAEELLKKYETL